MKALSTAIVVCCCAQALMVHGKPIDEVCSLPVKNLPKYEPLLIIDKKLALPEAHGHHLVLGANSNVLFACPGKNNALEAFKGSDDVTATCRGSENVDIGGQGYGVQNLGCVKSIGGEVHVKTGKCGGGKLAGVAMELGFRVQQHAWYPMIQLCHDPKASATLYATHTLHGGSLTATEHRGNRPNFHEGGVYETFNADNAYKQASQAATLAGLLGKRVADKYLAETFLSRGHLAPNADFVLDAYQDLSFFYVNTAPQWQSVNAGSWASLEKSVRRHAAKQGGELTVVTGTYGILKLKNEKGVPKEIYLYNNGTDRRLPVPEFFWKVVYDPKTQAGIAFVSLNNGFVEQVTPSDLLCPNVCDRYKWRPTGGSWHNLNTGFIYCCDVTALRQVIGYVPRLRVVTTLTFNG